MTRGSALVAVSALLGAVALVGGCGGDPIQGECGIEHRYDGARYLAVAEPPRQPRGVRVIGVADRRACGETIGHDDVHEVAGVSPKVAVVIDGYLLVRRGVTPPHRLLRAAERPVRCARPTVFRGTWRDSSEATRQEMPETSQDGSSVRPYRLEVDATGGDHAAFERWGRLRVTVLVTPETDLAPEDEHEAAYEGVPMRLATHCDGDRFVAERIDLEPGDPPGRHTNRGS
jgi:hypothetical protein